MKTRAQNLTEISVTKTARKAQGSLRLENSVVIGMLKTSLSHGISPEKVLEGLTEENVVFIVIGSSTQKTSKIFTKNILTRKKSKSKLNR